MQLIMCSFCLGCQEAQSQIRSSITATKSFPSSYIFLIFPFNSFFSLTFSFMSLVARGLKGIWKVVGGDEINENESEIYMKNLTF